MDPSLTPTLDVSIQARVPSPTNGDTGRETRGLTLIPDPSPSPSPTSANAQAATFIMASLKFEGSLQDTDTKRVQKMPVREWVKLGVVAGESQGPSSTWDRTPPQNPYPPSR